MMFWIPAALLALAATAVLLAGNRRKLGLLAGPREATLAIYKDQLSEIERDLAQGVLGLAEAEGQKAEIGRRLLAAAREVEQQPSMAGSRNIPALLILMVPLLAFAIYARQGAPHVPDVPRQARIAAAQQTGDLEALLAQVESHLEKTPNDVQGWKVIYPNYMSLGRYADAASAIGRIIDLEGPSAALYADLAEVLTFADQGLMSERAEAAAMEALKLDAANPKARYYEALSLMQKGKRDEAKARFQSLLATAPADAPWRSSVEGQLKALDAAPGPTVEDMKAASEMSPEEQQAMIRSMVDGLDARLAENGNDIEGWLRLIRARTVLKELDKAKAALDKARVTFANDKEAASALDALAKELKL